MDEERSNLIARLEAAWARYHEYRVDYSNYDSAKEGAFHKNQLLTSLFIVMALIGDYNLANPERKIPKMLNGRVPLPILAPPTSQWS